MSSSAWATIIKYHRLWYKQQAFVSHSSGGQEVQDQSASSGEGSLPGLQMVTFLLWLYMVKREREISSLTGALILS